MPLKKNDFIEVEYTGIVTEEDAIFDTTDEALAKEAEIFTKNAEYGPIIVCIGENHLIKGLDEFLIGKDVGEHKVILQPEQAFGKKDAKLIELIPIKKFIEQKINPVPGLQINIDGVLGIVRRVGGGRTLVDFNHPLANKEITYKVKVKRIVTDKKEQLQSLLKIMLRIKDANITIKDDKAKITLKTKIPPQIKGKLKEKIKTLIKLKEIEFLEEKKQENKSPNKDKKQENPVKQKDKKELTPSQ